MKQTTFEEFEADGEIKNETDAIDAIQNDRLAPSSTVRVKYIGTNGNPQEVHAEIEEAEVVEAGTEKGSGKWAYEVENTYFTLVFTPEGKNTHTISTTDREEGTPTLRTQVGGDLEDGGDSRAVGDVYSIEFTEPDRQCVRKGCTEAVHPQREADTCSTGCTLKVDRLDGERETEEDDSEDGDEGDVPAFYCPECGYTGDTGTPDEGDTGTPDEGDTVCPECVDDQRYVVLSQVEEYPSDPLRGVPTISMAEIEALEGDEDGDTPADDVVPGGRDRQVLPDGGVVPEEVEDLEYVSRSPYCRFPEECPGFEYDEEEGELPCFVCFGGHVEEDPAGEWFEADDDGDDDREIVTDGGTSMGDTLQVVESTSERTIVRNGDVCVSVESDGSMSIIDSRRYEGSDTDHDDDPEIVTDGGRVEHDNSVEADMGDRVILRFRDGRDVEGEIACTETLASNPGSATWVEPDGEGAVEWRVRPSGKVGVYDSSHGPDGLLEELDGFVREIDQADGRDVLEEARAVAGGGES
ncbi:hypothetical protein [Natronococcus roseus]|uniref:hypothetical protein n=1 Tax=Natronococcus roseus TaxID=1052014 RepID=UPI00374CA8A8